MSLKKIEQESLSFARFYEIRINLFGWKIRECQPLKKEWHSPHSTLLVDFKENPNVLYSWSDKSRKNLKAEFWVAQKTISGYRTLAIVPVVVSAILRGLNSAIAIADSEVTIDLQPCFLGLLIILLSCYCGVIFTLFELLVDLLYFRSCNLL